MKLLDMGTTPSPPYRMRSALGKEPLDNDNDDEDEDDDGMSSPPATAVRSIGRDASMFNQAINYVSDNASTTATATGGVASSATTAIAVATSVSTGTSDRMSSSDRLSSLSDAITRLRAASQLPSTTVTTTTTSSGAQAMQFNYSQPPPGDHHNGGGIGGGSREYRGAFGPIGYGANTTTTTSTTGKRGSPLSDRALMAALSRAQRGLLGGGNGSEGYNETTTSIASRQGLGQQGRGAEGSGGEINPPRHSALLGRMLVDHRPYPSSSQTLASNSSSSNAAAVAAAYAAIGIVSTVPTKATDMTTVVAMTTTVTATSITTATTTTTAASTTSTTAPIIATSNGPVVPSMMERRVKTVDFAPIDVVHRADAHIVPATAMSQYPTRATTTTTTTTTASTLAPTSVLPMSVQPSAHASLHAPVPPSSTHVSTATTASLPVVTSSSSSGGAEAGQGLGTGQGLGQGQGSVYFRRQLANFGPVAVGCMARQELGKYTHFTL